MNAADIDTILGACEADLASGADLDTASFWRAVAAVKRDPDLVDRFADRIGAVDRAAFAQWAPLRAPLWLGTALMTVGTAVGLALVAATYFVDEPWNGIAMILGTLTLAVAVHGLAHLVVGAIAGIRFIAWFATLRRPQPGVKTDYATYLRTPARARAWMHAAGAIATKLVPFVVLPVGPIAGAPWWATLGVLVYGVVQVVVDIAWSVKASDWKKYRREMAIARTSPGT
jgi:hypothetical protein